MKLKHYVTALLLSAVVNFTPLAVQAQDIDFGEGDPDGPPPTDVPLDDGVSILLAAGVVYGIKKIYDNKKEAAAKQVANIPKEQNQFKLVSTPVFTQDFTSDKQVSTAR